ncbi:hypothetical protein JB92DRAFT_1669383 [Gautieria morchelliformis]|nr:hypothetical protein JB92DRAFT_1669383 [Gautieria morchelliformis]
MEEFTHLIFNRGLSRKSDAYGLGPLSTRSHLHRVRSEYEHFERPSRAHTRMDCRRVHAIRPSVALVLYVDCISSVWPLACPQLHESHVTFIDILKSGQLAVFGMIHVWLARTSERRWLCC